LKKDQRRRVEVWRRSWGREGRESGREGGRGGEGRGDRERWREPERRRRMECHSMCSSGVDALGHWVDRWIPSPIG